MVVYTRVKETLSGPLQTPYSSCVVHAEGAATQHDGVRVRSRRVYEAVCLTLRRTSSSLERMYTRHLNIASIGYSSIHCKLNTIGDTSRACADALQTSGLL